jgi:hypothetical protein
MPKKQTKRKTSAKSTENMKMEIANDFGVNLGAEATSRENGAVGGEMTRRLVQMGQERSNSCSNNSRSKSKNKSKSNK